MGGGRSEITDIGSIGFRHGCCVHLSKTASADGGQGERRKPHLPAAWGCLPRTVSRRLWRIARARLRADADGARDLAFDDDGHAAGARKSPIQTEA